MTIEKQPRIQPTTIETGDQGLGDSPFSVKKWIAENEASVEAAFLAFFDSLEEFNLNDIKNPNFLLPEERALPVVLSVGGVVLSEPLGVWPDMSEYFSVSCLCAREAEDGRDEAVLRVGHKNFLVSLRPLREEDKDSPPGFVLFHRYSRRNVALWRQRKEQGKQGVDIWVVEDPDRYPIRASSEQATG